MIWTMLGNAPARRAARMLTFTTLVLGGGLVGACGLLDVSDPTVLEEDQLDNAASANLLRNNAVNVLASAVAQSALTSGLLTDEFFADPAPGSTASHEQLLDQRESEQYEQSGPSGTSGAYGRLQVARRAASEALPRVRAYTPEPARAAYTGQVLALRGYTTLRLAEDFCPGFPLNEVVDGKLVFGPPTTTAAALQQALADFDAAVAAAADTARFLHLAQVGRARTLLALGRFAEAAEAAQPVPDAFVWQVWFASPSPVNPLSGASACGGCRFNYTASGSRLSVSNNEGGTGLDFGSAGDPRVVTSSPGLAHDETTPIRLIGKYPDAASPIVAASGIEAHLIEAEAALQAGGNWLGILNAVRTDGTQTGGVWNPGSGGVAGLALLADPGSDADRVDLVFRERAFWLFGTGSRLADLRRLIQHYGRAVAEVFPAGDYRLGGSYGTATSVPFPADPESVENPAITGCLSR